MKLLTRHSDYAVQALCSLAEKNRVVSVTELCEELAIPRPFLRALLQQLARHGYVVSHKGKGGGFALGKAPSSIRLIDIMKVFQGPIELNRCQLAKRPCPRMKGCGLRVRLQKIEKYVLKELRSVSIADLLRS